MSSFRTSTIVFVALAVLVTNVVHSARPKKNETGHYVSFALVRTGGDYRIFTLTACFDQPLFVDTMFPNGTTELLPIDHRYFGKPMTGDIWPRGTRMHFNGSASATLKNTNLDSVITDSDGPPNFLMASNDADDPGGLFTSRLGNVQFSSDQPSDRCMTYLYIIGSRSGKSGPFQYMGAFSDEDDVNASLANGGISLSVRENAFMNQAREGNEAFTITFTPADMKTYSCEFETLRRYDKMVQEAEQVLKSRNYESHNEYSQSEFIVGSLATRQVFQACIDVINPLIETDVIEQSVETDSCQYADGSAEYMADPCCNHTLEYQMCCAPKEVSFDVVIVDGLDDDQVAETCAAKHNDIVQSRAADFLKQQNEGISLAGTSVWDVIEAKERQVYGAERACDYELYEKECTSDDQCLSGECTDGRCNVPWGSDGQLWIECFIDELNATDPELLNSMMETFSISTTDALMTKMEEVLIHDDCIGWNSWEYKMEAYYDWNDEIGDLELVVRQEKNLTACLAEKECNWDNWLSEDDCLLRGSENALKKQFLGDSLCTRCYGPDGSYCHREWEARPSQCQKDSFTDQASCEAHGYAWFRPSQWDHERCVDLDATTAEQCIDNADWCPSLYDKQGNYVPWMCSGSWRGGCVFDPEYVNETECDWAYMTNNGNSAYMYWDHEMRNGSGLCMFRYYTNSLNRSTEVCQAFYSNVLWGNDGLNASHLSYFRGGVFEEGKFDTKESCEQGRCEYDNPVREKADFANFPEEKCSQLYQCTENVPMCVQHHWPGRSLCVATADVLTETECENVVPGRSQYEWNAWNGSDARCVLDYNLDRDSCLAMNATYQPVYADCGLSQNESTCGMTGVQEELRGLLNCHWEGWAQPINQQQCESKGRCDDWEFERWDRNTEKSILGGCLVRKTLRDGWPDDCPSSVNATIGDKTYSFTRLHHTRMSEYCVVDDMYTEANCTAASGIWKTKAKTQQECEALGSFCDYDLNPWNGFSETECTKCDSEMKPLYRWRAGQWKAAQMTDLRWQKREYASRNSVGPTRKYWEMYQIRSAATRNVAKLYFQNDMKAFSQRSPTLLTLACACSVGADQRTQCNDFSRPIPLTSAQGQNKASIKEKDVKMTFSNTGGNNSSNSTAPSRRRLLQSSQATSPTLVVIDVQKVLYGNVLSKNVLNGTEVIGQLVSDCFSIDVTGANSGTLTISRRLDIDLPNNNTYSKAHIVSYANNVLNPVYVTDATGTSDKLSVTSNQISQSGVYCYALMVPSFVPSPYVVPSPTSAPPTTASSTSSPTSATPTSDSNTSSPAGTPSPTSLSGIITSVDQAGAVSTLGDASLVYIVVLLSLVFSLL